MHLMFLLPIALLAMLASACNPAPSFGEPLPTAAPGATASAAATTPAGEPFAPAETPSAQPAPTVAPTSTPAPARPTPVAPPSCFQTPAPANATTESVTAVAATTQRAWALVYSRALTRTTVYYSDDAGVSWTAGRFFSDFVSSISASPVYTRDQSVFAVGAGGVYRSFNGGLSWGSISPSLWYTSTPIVRQFALSPDYGNDRLMLMGSPAAPRGVYASTDGGVRWKDWLVDAVDMLLISPNYLIDRAVWVARNDAQTFRRDVMVTTSQGSTWELVRSGSAMPLAISPAFSQDSTMLWGDLQGGLYVSRNSDREFPAINKSAGDALAIWKETPGQGWSVVGEETARDIKFSADFARDRNAYAVSDSSFLATRDGGTQWTPVCGWGFAADKPDAVRFDRLAIAPEGTLFAGGAGARVAVSRDGGRTWTLASLK